jgi:hypothetical protein
VYNLAFINLNLGQYDAALIGVREEVSLNPSFDWGYGFLIGCYRDLNRLEEARAAVGEAQAKVANYDAHEDLYWLAFVEGNSAAMQQQVAWWESNPGGEDMLGLEADTAAYYGQLRKARALYRRAVAADEREDEKAHAAGEEAGEAVTEALFGNAPEARQLAASARGLSMASGVQYEEALALALAGDATQTKALANDLSHRFPEGTYAQSIWLPTVRAQLALSHNDAAEALEALQTAAPYELGTVAALYPVYVRGEAYLAAHQGAEAAAEFQKILDHRGIVCNEPIGALAHLQIARAYAMQGDTAKARAAYQDFLTLWKDADPNIPVLIAAKAEYAKLK